MRKVIVVLAMLTFLVSVMIAGCGGSKIERAKMGKSFTFWQESASSKRNTKFSITFTGVSETKKHPLAGHQASEGKKYVVITAKVENLGPRKGHPECPTEVKVDKGYLYDIFLFCPGKPIYETLKPGEVARCFFTGEIPENTTPVELIGTFGGSFGGITGGGTKFRLKLR